jgi:hypothetical protein
MPQADEGVNLLHLTPNAIGFQSEVPCLRKR